MSYPETQDIRTKKALEHQRNALKGKGNDISNAEIVPEYSKFGFIKMYHGTNVAFDVPNQGIWLTELRKQASAHGKIVKEFYIKPTNVIDFREDREYIFDPSKGEPDFSVQYIKGFQEAPSWVQITGKVYTKEEMEEEIKLLENKPAPVEEIDVPDLNEKYLKERFLFHARKVWGDVIDKINFKFTKRPPKKGHILSLAYSSRPTAIRNTLVSAPAEMTLYYSDAVFEYSKEDFEKIVIHEVIHIGYPGHSEAFIKEVVKFGGIKSIAHLEGLGIQVQAKKRADKRGRFKTIMTFKDDEEELAREEANKYAREHRDEKVRLQY